ncbi:MAG: hypothetical protein Q4G30_04950 [Actinomycetaceae bacterium]|nr:hypothetical protein [Actinomycetaceae bacterium]
MWLEALTADQLSQVEAEKRRLRDLEAQESQGIEAVDIVFGDRLLAAAGQPVRLVIDSGEVIEGVVIDATHSWVLMRGSCGVIVVGTASIIAAWELCAVPKWSSRIDRELRLTTVLRDAARRGVSITVEAAGLTVTGFVARVGADFVDLMDAHKGKISVVLHHVRTMRIPQWEE